MYYLFQLSKKDKALLEFVQQTISAEPPHVLTELIRWRTNSVQVSKWCAFKRFPYYPHFACEYWTETGEDKFLSHMNINGRSFATIEAPPKLPCLKILFEVLGNVFPAKST